MLINETHGWIKLTLLITNENYAMNIMVLGYHAYNILLFPAMLKYSL